MDRLITDHALLADLLSTRFELRLDEADDLTILGDQGLHHRQHELQADKADIDGHEPCLLSDILRLHIADVRLLHADHTRIVSELPVELAVADIDGEDPDRTVLQHAVGEAAGAGTDIEADLTFTGDAELADRLLELQTATGDVRQHVTTDLDLGFRIEGGAGLVFLLTIDIHDAGHDGALRFFSGFCQSSIDQQHVKSFFLH